MWSISVTINHAKVSKKCAKELFEAQAYEGEIWYSLEDVVYKGKLQFNSDHNEHMDYLANHDNMLEILKKHKVKGDICFGSLQGDNDGSFWGYRFDGEGGLKTLTGTILYVEDKKDGEKK
jgi:hypothetical protein